ncbi:tol-pal system-associated acyl-CoA thioesterase [Falsigemmobacter intermedius]|uniref:tol-pal system-associated acyl-CoA thioesterase n=1 Tax=Falsigemmobacter intermedius TaxID=1553448 RepID=UPI003F108C42
MHRFDLRVYYEDTDLAGIVYYANYLKFIERGRSEWLRALGFDQRALKEETGTVFAVRRLDADYIAPAKFDDALMVLSTAEAVTPARLVLAQQVLRGEERLFEAKVTLVALNAAGGPTRLPKPLRDSFAALV